MGAATAATTDTDVVHIPWVRMPVRVWREAIDRHFPGCGRLRLPDDLMDGLPAYRSRRALPSWEATVRELPAAAEVEEPAR
ncbi:DUF6084 family protein [Kitasatospora xanthocidica]|uniref:DUF6084 family protein n=1 Tax=Kitasatospora xanthocidica TaxID=83382 RepID=UPI0036F0C49A